MAEDGFLQRWSKRKSLQGVGTSEANLQPNALPLVGSAQANGTSPTPGASPAHGDTSQRRSAQTVAAPAPDSPASPLAPQAPRSDPAPAPLMADAQALTPASDFRPFMAQGVAPEVKNAAMKKLFADPHFNVMDRMDIYIDDYSQPDPLPLAMLRQMNGAKFLNLFEAEDPAPDQPASAPSPTAGKLDMPLLPEVDGTSVPASAHTTPNTTPNSKPLRAEAPDALYASDKASDRATHALGDRLQHNSDASLSPSTRSVPKA